MADRKPLVRVGGKIKQLPAVDSLSKSVVGLSNVTNDAQAKASIYPNTVPAAGRILVGQVTGKYESCAIAGDATMSESGLLTINNGKVTNAKLAAAAAKSIKGNQYIVGAAPQDLTPAEARTVMELGTAAVADTGTGPSNVILGNDSRLSDAREWTADTVSQVEAEAGTATTRRAWTAQRARQAIAAWWASADAPQDSKQYVRKDGAWVELYEPGHIGTQGGQGFGVGVCPNESILIARGLFAMPGTTDKTHANYGNYQHTNGSIVCYVPKFFYRIGSSSSPRYATYGENALDIVGIEAFADEAAANAAGYALHRAFINAGFEQGGFFFDKYLASKDGTTSCKSIANADPISLTTSASHNPSNGMTGCTGILADAVVLARARGAGWNCASAFQQDAVATLSLAHGQAATSATYCAWYDATGTTNFPKGCNNNALADHLDATVTYAASHDKKPKTRATANFAKTTHNGQECGIADINGSMWQALIGLTMAGTSGTDATQNTTGTAFVLKPSADFGALTGGHGGANDAWGTTASLATNFDQITGFEPWLATTGWTYYGNGSNKVFSGATSGIDYLRKCAGIPLLTGCSATGTSQFGNDGCYQYGRANQVPVAAGLWSGAASAGAFYRYWAGGRSDANSNCGFRCAAY